MVDVSLRSGDGSTGPRSTRSPTRRRPRIGGGPGALPNARAIVGALLCVTAALLAWYAATGRADEPVQPMVVASRDISAGMLVSAEDLRIDEVVMTPGLRVRTFGDPTRVIGRIALGPIGSGDPILQSATDAGDAFAPNRQFSLNLPVAAAVGGSLRSGDTVDMLATVESDGKDVTETLARNVLVSRVTGADANVMSPTGDRLVTFSVPAELDVESVVHAAATGKVHLIRTTGAATATSTNRAPGGQIAETGPSR
jgi:Flp pilus assembly protein CpaB